MSIDWEKVRESRSLFQNFGNDHFDKSMKPPFYIIPSKVWCIHSYIPVLWCIKLMLWEEHKVVVIVAFAGGRTERNQFGYCRGMWHHESVKDLQHIAWKVWVPVVNKIIKPPCFHPFRNLVRVGKFTKKFSDDWLQFRRKSWEACGIQLLKVFRLFFNILECMPGISRIMDISVLQSHYRIHYCRCWWTIIMANNA